MQFIESNVTYIEPDKNSLVQTNHIAKCARICYASDCKDDVGLVLALYKSKHYSMFRHETLYFILKYKDITNMDGSFIYPFINKNENNPYIKIINDVNTLQYYIVCNGQYAIEHPEIIRGIIKYKVPQKKFEEEGGKNFVRLTFFIETQISTTRELNRVSPNNIAEQSTRYVNFGKEKHGKSVKYCLPVWYNNKDTKKIYKFIFKLYLKISEIVYLFLVNHKFYAQDAREVLPLCTYTKVAYTYSIEEWMRIIDLRYYGVTGQPHPNAKLIVGKIREEMIKLGYKL